jgi:molybdate transport system substrate-binding protein
LTTLGVWDSVAGKLAPADNVRSALALVARGEVPLGIVYRTDALVEPKVRIVDTFPKETHPPIVYPAALTTTASPAARRVIEFLRSPSATRDLRASRLHGPGQLARCSSGPRTICRS